MQNGVTVRASMAAVGCLSMAAIGAVPGTTKFSYQGQLKRSGVPVSDMCDVRGTFWNAAIQGSIIAGPQSLQDVEVTNGLFDVEFDFGASVFVDTPPWLELSFRCPHDPTGTVAFTSLSPRQQIVATPYAIQMRGIFVADNGDLGIGTSNPAERLDIAGGVAVGGLPVITADGHWVGNPTGLQGPPGPPPAHQWSGTSLRFQNPNSTWAPYVNLQGATGVTGAQGSPGTAGSPPAHQWSGTSLRFQNPNGTWGAYVNLQGQAGPAVSTSAACRSSLPPASCTSQANANALCAGICQSNLRIVAALCGSCNVTSDTDGCSSLSTNGSGVCCVCKP